jgi:hypothetical protein
MEFPIRQIVQQFLAFVQQRVQGHDALRAEPAME